MGMCAAPRYLCEGPNLLAIRTAHFTLERISTTLLAAYRQLCRAGRPCRLKSRSWRVSFFQADVSRYPGYMRGSVASYVICVTFCALGPRKGLSDYGRSSRRELRRKCDGRHSAANTTNGTPVTGVPRPSIIPSPDTLHAFHHVGVSSHGPLDGHNNCADLRCNSWFGQEITQKCDQSGQRDSSEQHQPATSILRHHSMAEVDLERTTPKTTKIVRSTPFYDVSDRAINVLQRTTLECPSGHPAKLGRTLEASLFIHSRRFGSHSSPPISAECPD